MGHANRRLLYAERWLWDERYGLMKPERSSKIAAEGLCDQFFKVAKNGNKNLIRIKNEPIFAQIPIPMSPIQKLTIDDEAIEVN